jgi:fibronectin type 3 domain-containing protein
VSLAWTPPTQLNGSTLLGFYVYCGTSTGSMVRWGSMLGPEVRSVNVTGLAPGVRYFFAVSAQTSTVETEWSNMLNAIPYTVPSAPALNSATAGTGNVTLVWTAPSSNGGSAITGYRVYYGTSATPATLFGTFGASMNTVVVTSLTPGTLYYFGVKAVNAAGDSALSNVLSATPLGVPSAPTLINATAGMGTVMVTWEAPSSTGSSPITGYQVYFGLSSPDTAFGGVVGPSVRQLTVTELTPGTLYYFGVRAINSVGASDMSNVRSATPYSLPSAPELITAVAGSDWVSLTWTAPSSNGSGPLTGYLVYYGIASPPTTQFGTMLSPTTMSINVTGLTTGTLYYFGVKAVNGYGNGPLSNVLNATPVTVPPAPNGLTYTATSTQISLSWQEVSGATSYGIYRGSTQLTLVLIANSTSPAYVDINVLSGATFYYKVSARNAQGEGPKSPVLQVTVPAPSKVAITGIVTDAGGKPLSGITVKLEDGTTATTNATGGFTLMALPGNHTLTISGPGIETQSVLVTVGSGGTNIGSIATKAATDWTWLIIIIVIIVIGLIIVMFLMRGRGKKPAQAKAPEKK